MASDDYESKPWAWGVMSAVATVATVAAVGLGIGIGIGVGIGSGKVPDDLGVLGDITHTNHKTTQCSGILGVVGSKGSTRDYFLEGLALLHNQGYNGVGIASIDGQQGLMISKLTNVDGVLDENSNDNDKENSKKTKHDAILHLIQHHYSTHKTLQPTEIAHTRWATQGDKLNEANVHPHLDASGKIALIHNGSLTNARALREELVEKGYTMQGQTDSEVLAQLVGHYYQGGKVSVKEATEHALRRCIGTWGGGGGVAYCAPTHQTSWSLHVMGRPSLLVGR